MIFLTASNDPRLMVDGINVGARYYVIKPFDLDELHREDEARVVSGGSVSASEHGKRPSDLRAELEAAARRVVDQLRASAVVVQAADVAARVVEEHQDIPEVRKRLDFMWRHIEEYVETILSAD